MVYAPRREDSTESMVKVISSPDMVPTCKDWAENVPFKTWVPLYRVFAETREISSCSWLSSLFAKARSVADTVALADCTASSRILCSMPDTSTRAFSTVLTSAMPSLAFLVAMVRPRICEFIRSTIASPAASSAALLMRLPVDNRSMANSISSRDSVIARCA